MRAGDVAAILTKLHEAMHDHPVELDYYGTTESVETMNAKIATFNGWVFRGHVGEDE